MASRTIDGMRGVCRVVGWGAAWAIAVGFSCTEEELRPEVAGDCNEPSCMQARRGNPAAIIGSVVQLGGEAGAAGAGEGVGGAAGAGGAAGGSGMPPEAGTLAGTVQVLVAADLVSTSSLNGQVEIRAPGADGVTLAAQPALDGTYRLTGVLPSNGLWVGVGSFKNPPEEPFMDTLQLVDSTTAGLVDLLVVRRDVMAELAQFSLLNGPIEIDAGAAQLVFEFIDLRRAPVEGVQIQFPSPDRVSTAYDAGDIYSDSLQETSTRGRAILLNLPAAPYPGGLTSIVVDLPDRDADLSLDVRIARGSVSIVRAVVPDP